MYYPTAYEGQGLPPQEAMASGCPVVAYRNTSVEEVVGSERFLLNDPVPWSLQTLSQALPQTGRGEVVAIITNWVESPSQLAEARAVAVQLSGKYSWTAFSGKLEQFYGDYFEGRRL
jgi:glycosyltransferase involved in cell wall biosynthesis